MNAQIARPANAVVCSCPKGWHLTFVARERCPHRTTVASQGIQAAVKANIKRKAS